MPERWLAGSTIRPHEPAAYIPFSAGQAQCLGKIIALQEVRMVAAFFVQRFDVSIGPSFDEKRWAADRQELIIMRRAALPVKVVSRGR